MYIVHYIFKAFILSYILIFHTYCSVFKDFHYTYVHTLHMYVTNRPKHAHISITNPVKNYKKCKKHNSNLDLKVIMLKDAC